MLMNFIVTQRRVMGTLVL